MDLNNELVGFWSMLILAIWFTTVAIWAIWQDSKGKTRIKKLLEHCST